MSLVALIVAVVAALIAAGSLCYTRRADQARSRTDRAAPLHRIGTLIREVAAAQAASASDPMAPADMQAKLARLKEAVEVADVNLQDCAAYASNADPALRPAAERELERAIAAAGRT